MPSRKKKFINKKEAVTFHLVHRSQKDPLQASEEASKHVLVPEGREKRLEEQRKYGVFFDDEYDYMQHLKEVDEAFELVQDDRCEKKPDREPTLRLPSSVFASKVEKEVGLLNEAVPIRGPRPDWDPDIVEALDDDFDVDDPDNQLEDDFILKANKPVSSDEENEDGSDADKVSIASDEANMSDDDFDEDFRYGDHQFMDEETKSRFTNYSMSSSIIRRSEGLTLLDDRFEKVFEGYDDSEIGALDQEDIDGSIRQGSEVLNKILDEFEEKQRKIKLEEIVDSKEDADVDLVSEESDESDTEMVRMVIEEPQDKWDCESILSTYSNLYNHPKLITEPKKEKEIKLKGKHNLPEESIATRGLTQKQITDDLLAKERSDKASTYRPKGETAVERADRKKAIKEERRERRQEKKINKKAFTVEKIRQERDEINLNKNLKGIKIV